MSRKLYEYLTPSDAHVSVFESVESDGTKNYGMQGIFVQGNKKNQNGRIYPASEIQKAVDSIRGRLDDGETVMGELDHPEELQINLDRVSHIITDIQMVGADGIGKLKIIETPMGNIAKALMSAGAKLGVSSRGSGNVSDSGHVSDFDCITVDIVAQPSAPDAYPRAIYESLYNMRGGEIIMDIARANTHTNKDEKHLIKGVKQLIKELKLR